MMEGSQTYFPIDHFLNDTFSHIGSRILDHLDLQSLINCKLVNKGWLRFIENEKFSWHKEINFVKGKVQKSERLVDLMDQLQTRDKALDYVKSMALVARSLPCNPKSETLEISFMESLLKIQSDQFSSLIMDSTNLGADLEQDWMTFQKEAAKLDELEFYTFLASLSKNVNPVINNNGATVLHYSPKRIKLWILDQLDECMDVNVIETKMGVTPLHTAATVYNQEPEPFQKMASRVQDVNVQDNEGNTPLHFYILMENFNSKSDMDSMVEFIDGLFNHAPKSDANRENVNGISPLEIAAEFGLFKIFEKIALHIGPEKLEAFQFPKGNTALHYAVWSDNPDFVSFILNTTKIDPIQADAEGDTPLQLAVDFRYFESFKCLAFHLGAETLTSLKFHNAENLLHFAVDSNDLTLIQWVLDHCKPSLDQKNCDGKTPLERASDCGHFEAFKIIAYQAQPQLLESIQRLLHSAIQTKDPNFIQWILETCKVDPKEPCEEGITPLQLAAANSDGTFFALVAMKISEADPLTLAAEFGHYDAFKMIAFAVEKQALESWIFKKSRNALHFAALMDDTKLIKYILEHTNIDPNQRDEDGNTPLQLNVMVDGIQGFKAIAIKLGLKCLDHQIKASFMIRKAQKSVPIFVPSLHYKFPFFCACGDYLSLVDVYGVCIVCEHLK